MHLKQHDSGINVDGGNLHYVRLKNNFIYMGVMMRIIKHQRQGEMDCVCTCRGVRADGMKTYLPTQSGFG